MELLEGLSYYPFDMALCPFFFCFGDSIRSVLVSLGLAFTFIYLIFHIVNNHFSFEIISLVLSYIFFSFGYADMFMTINIIFTTTIPIPISY